MSGPPALDLADGATPYPSGATGSPGNRPGPPPPRPVLKCTGCEVRYAHEKDFFAYHLGRQGVHSPVWTSPPLGGRGPVSTCRLCKVTLYEKKSLRAHKKMKSHIDLSISKGVYCVPCKKSFDSDRSIRTHWLGFHDPSRPTEFRCCDCQENFHTNRLLRRHACPSAPPAGYHTCEPCNIKFSGNKELVLHLNSKYHKPHKCLGGGGCIRRFRDLPGMLQHLESGACVSKMDRKTIDALLRKHDTGNIITIEGAGGTATPAIPPSLSSASQISSASAVFEEEMEIDSGDEGSDGVILTPTSTLPLGSISGSGAQTPTGPQDLASVDSSGFAGAFTPLSGGISELELRLRDPRVCPICSKKFNLPGGLSSHMASPVHAVPKYHCPKEFLEEMGMEMDRHGLERAFKTLSGLAQHIHARACTTDKDAWAKMLQFLEDKLGVIGYDGVRLLSQ